MSQHCIGLLIPIGRRELFRRDDNKIQWRPEGGDLYFAQSRPIIVEFSEEVATRPHLLARDASVQEREQSAVIGCRNGDEAIDPRTASKHLNIVAANQSTHAEADEIDSFPGREMRSDVVAQLQR